MALSDLFRKKTPAVDSLPLEQSSYDIAYFILPNYVFGQLEELIEKCVNAPAVFGPFFYWSTCQAHGVEPDINRAKLYQWRNGTFDDARRYLLLEYPDPAPVDLMNESVTDLMKAGRAPVLAPYFSLILYGDDVEPLYFLLGQSPSPGRTTVRQVRADGANCNLGPGPEPRVDPFFDRVREIVARTDAAPDGDGP